MEPRPSSDEHRREQVEHDVDLLLVELLDLLGPALAWWRVEAARRLGLDAPSYVCLELLRRRRSVSPAQIAERTAMTRSAVSKMLRRLEEAGHVDLRGGGDRGHALEVVLRPHPERDAELDRLRSRLRNRLRWGAGAEFDECERSATIRMLRRVSGTVHESAADSSDVAAAARRARARRADADRRARAADVDPLDPAGPG